MTTRWFRILFATLALLTMSIVQSGCALCCGTYDEAYAGHGGKWQRNDLFHGRVGSPFSDPHAYHSHGEVIETTENSQLEVIE